MGVAQAFGSMGRERGGQRENRFLAVFREHPRDAPEWFRGVERASRELDRKGIDAIIYTDVGKIFIQIKSSQGGKRRFEELHPRTHIIVIIIRGYDLDESIRKSTYQLVGVRRDIYVAKRQARLGS
ncbi:MAG: hypothetical protein AAB372_00210 [Patescibacteria group bacterium]